MGCQSSVVPVQRVLAKRASLTTRSFHLEGPFPSHEFTNTHLVLRDTSLPAPFPSILFQPSDKLALPLRPTGDPQIIANKTHPILKGDTREKETIELHQIALSEEMRETKPRGIPARSVVIQIEENDSLPTGLN